MKTARKLVSLALVASLFAALVAVPSMAFAGTGTKITVTKVGKSSPKSMAKLTASLKTADGKAIKQVKLKLWKSSVLASGETTWSVVAKPQTNAKGRALVNVRPAQTAKYYFEFAGNAKYDASKSPVVLVGGYEPKTRYLYGSADATESVSLTKGLAVFSVETTAASGAFKVVLLDSKKKVIDAQEFTAPYSGSYTVSIAKTGKYTLVVNGTDWMVRIAQPRKFTAGAFKTLKGTGDYVSPVWASTPKSKKYTFAWKSTTDNPYRFVIKNQTGTKEYVIAEGEGIASGFKKITLPKGFYVVEVTSTGAWSLGLNK